MADVDTKAIRARQLCEPNCAEVNDCDYGRLCDALDAEREKCAALKAKGDRLATLCQLLADHMNRDVMGSAIETAEVDGEDELMAPLYEWWRG